MRITPSSPVGGSAPGAAREIGVARSRRRSPAAASDIREATRHSCVRRDFSTNPSYGSCGEVFARRWRPARARGARHRTVACYALLARVASPGRELTGNLIAPTEVDLVRCLAVERGVGDPLVVLGHVERDELLHRRDVVERVQEQPPMFE